MEQGNAGGVYPKFAQEDAAFTFLTESMSRRSKRIEHIFMYMLYSTKYLPFLQIVILYLK
jgi:hypothetical protein